MKLPGWLIIVLVAVVILAAAGAAVITVSWLGPIGGGPQSVASKNLGGQGTAPANGPLYEVGAFTVNLTSSGGLGNYLRTTVVLEVNDEETAAVLDERKPAVRDAVIAALRDYTAAELRESQGMEKLKESVRFAVTSSLDQDGIRQVYFTDFIIQ